MAGKKNVQTTKKNLKPLKKKLEKKKRRLKLGRVFLVLFFVGLFSLLFFSLQAIPITNLYIRGNHFYSDQQIIELAGLEEYPSSLKNSSNKIRKKLEKETYLAAVKVSKKWLTRITITVTENRPLFFNQTTSKTVLFNQEEVTDRFAVPTLLNYVPDTIYDSFVLEMGKLDPDVMRRISEVKYDPNTVDEHRFLLTMDDENLVYVTLDKFSNLNNYIEIIRKFENQKGILYLDYGTRFEVLEK